ncbi:hypothetical protein CSB37_01380 [bacterium DOLZORAL124_38_8]|nr:MAG: hypothetical protein CSB37_01380 [bacterium DOLZORAL124_38_8]
MKIELAQFTPALEEWFKEYGRHDLPWRKNITPYRVWVSEIMLQQTQVSRVQHKFFPRFLEKFPTIFDLAKAEWKDLFPVWDGLGYYARGKNMLKTAKILVEQNEGNFPQKIELLEALPGIGKYTATAILAFAFDEKVPAIDTNLKKVFQSLCPKQSPTETGLELIKSAQSGRDWNNALMDLSSCLRFRKELHGDIANFFPEEKRALFLPKKRLVAKKMPKKKVLPKGAHTIEVGVACIHKDGKYLVQTRPKGKSFAGKWEFPGGKREKGEDFRTCVKREVQEELGIDVSVRPFFHETVHTFDKVNLRLRFHRCQIQSGEPKCLENQTMQWVASKDFESIDFLPTNSAAIKALKEFKN